MLLYLEQGITEPQYLTQVTTQRTLPTLPHSRLAEITHMTPSKAELKAYKRQLDVQAKVRKRVSKYIEALAKASDSLRDPQCHQGISKAAATLQ